MKIFVIHHKGPVPDYPENYIPMFVGACRNDSSWKEYCQTDDTLDNISEKNDSYCELTGLYWIWKNCMEDYVGMVHYRRFFLGGKRYKRIQFRNNIYTTNPEDTSICHIMRTDEAEKLLKHKDFIVKKSRIYHWNLRAKYLDLMPKECMDHFECVLKSDYPEVYPVFERYLKKHSHILCSMFIGKKKKLDEYCEWLFPILETVDQKRFELTGEYFHNREIGYFGELLFGLWLEYYHVSFTKQYTLMPKKSAFDTVEGITIEGGSNIYKLFS